MVVVCLQISKVKKMPKEKAPCKCLSIIILDSVIKANKEYYSQTLLGERKYKQEKKLIDDYLEKSESDKSDSDSNHETKYDNESNE